MTALHLAVDKGHLDIVRLLLEKGANIKAVNNVSNRPCMTVCLPANMSACVCVYVCVICMHMCVLAFDFITIIILIILCLFLS